MVKRILCMGKWVLAGCLAAHAGCVIPWQDLDPIFLQSPGPPVTSPADLGLAYEDVRIASANGNKLAGWFVPALSGQSRATFLVHTGMRGNLDTYLPLVPWAVENDFNILVYDWQGFGASEGVPDFTHFEPDTYAAVEYVVSRPESNGGIIQLGASLGTACAMAAATAYPDQTIGLVLYGAAFKDNFATLWLSTQVAPALALLGPFGDAAWNAILPDFFDTARYLAAIQVPILAITPEDDTIVPPEAQRKFYDALPEPKQRYITYGGHVHAPDVDPQLGIVVVEWARGVVSRRNGLE